MNIVDDSPNAVVAAESNLQTKPGVPRRAGREATLPALVHMVGRGR